MENMFLGVWRRARVHQNGGRDYKSLREVMKGPRTFYEVRSSAESDKRFPCAGKNSI